MLQRIDKVLPRVYIVLVTIFFISCFCALRAVSSIGIMCMVAVSLAGIRLKTGRWWNPHYLNLFSLGCALFFALQIVALLYTHNMSEGTKVLQLKSVLIVAPIMAVFMLYIGKDNWRRMMVWYVYAMMAACAYCLVHAAMYYSATGDSSIFFYHPLVSAFEQHAIQFAIFVFAAILFLKESFNKGQYLLGRGWHMLFIIYLLVFLLLLSSKLVIIITALYFVYELVFRKKFARSALGRVTWLVGILAAITLLFAVKNPIRDRFVLEVYGKIDFITQKHFDPGDYFTGTQFRLLQWRFTDEILSERKRWWLGVSPGDAQDWLDKKYIAMNMYVGGRADTKNKTGFLGYNTHDQFLQSILENGIPGLLTFLLACAGLVTMAIKKKDMALSFIVLTLITFSFTESVWETQYGLILFTFLPLLFYYRPEDAPQPQEAAV